MVVALAQTVVGDADVILRGELRHRPPVVGHVHHLLIRGDQAVRGTVAGVAPVVGGEWILLVQLLLAEDVVQDGPGVVEVQLVGEDGPVLTGGSALPPALLFSVESSGAELERRA